MSFFQERHPSLGKTIALVDYAGVYGPKNTLFPCFVEVRSCGPAYNPSASGGLPLEPDTSPDIMNSLGYTLFKSIQGLRKINTLLTFMKPSGEP